MECVNTRSLVQGLVTFGIILDQHSGSQLMLTSTCLTDLARKTDVIMRA